MGRLGMLSVIAVAVIAGTAAVAVGAQNDYTVDVVLPSATNVNEGSPLLIDGLTAGSVERITADDGKARLTLELDDEQTPLHDGAKVTVKWKSLVGERIVEVHDGPEGNAAIPSGGLVTNIATAPMEIDQVLAALDKPTRKQLKSLVSRLNDTVKGSEDDLRKTLASAGPALSSLGDVLQGLGRDGEAISQLVTQLDHMVGTLAAGDDKVRKVVAGLSEMAAATAGQREQLGQSLEKLPRTLDRASGTLGDLPGAVDEAAPLLRDLKPATAKLPSVARNLKPLLRDLRPTVARLRPTLATADQLLGHTPGLLDTAHDVLPGFNTTVQGLREPLYFLRPYTPEMAGALTNWASAVGNYSGSGHYTRFNISYGAHSFESNPGVIPPGYSRDRQPAPGSLVGQPWTDAYGSGVQ